jgi:hypothetical protein
VDQAIANKEDLGMRKYGDLEMWTPSTGRFISGFTLGGFAEAYRPNAHCLSPDTLV